ncbi:MAG: hypothetical protein ACOY3F_00840 [Bacillota bacterium]
MPQADDSGAVPETKMDQNVAERALDELLKRTILYRSSREYRELLKFVARFRGYSPFNALLVHIQKPGAMFVAPPDRWLRQYGRVVKPGARPLVILQPMGPVMFVFDLSDTEGKPFPAHLESPFHVRGGPVGDRLHRLVENSKRDGVFLVLSEMGSGQAGSIDKADSPDRVMEFGEFQVAVRYVVEVNRNLNDGARYASLVHELGHLYCGHLGTPDPRWWPDREGLPEEVREFEAESVAYLVCQRAGLEIPSAPYLAVYLEECPEVPPISLYRVMKAAGLIEEMSLRNLPAREKERKVRQPERATVARTR